MDFTIKSFERVGPVKFGMSIMEVRRAIDSPVHSFKKTQTSVMETDAFPDLGVHVYYKLPGACEAIELGHPAKPSLQGHDLIGLPFSEILAWIHDLDTALQISDTGFKSFKCGIGVYAPYAVTSPKDPVQGVLVFERCYFD